MQPVCSFVLAVSVPLPDSVMTYIHSLLLLLHSFTIEIIAEAQAKFPLMNTRSFLSVYDTYRFLYTCGREEREKPLALPIAPTDFCVHVSPYF